MSKSSSPIFRRLTLILLLAVPIVAGLSWWARGRLAATEDLVQARAAYEREDWEQSAEWARRRLKATRDDEEAFRFLARSLIRTGRDDAGAAIYKRLGVPAMQAEDLCVLGQSLLRSGKRDAAREVLEGSLALDPDHDEARFELTRLYLNFDRQEDARHSAVRLARRPGWESRAEAILGTILLEQNDPAAAADTWLRALSRPRPTVHAEGTPTPIVPATELARALLRAGRPVEAIGPLREAMSESRRPEIAWLLSRADLQRKDFGAFRIDLKQTGTFRDEHPILPEPSPYVGTAACSPCHADRVRTQWASRHAQTFTRPRDFSKVPVPDRPVHDPADASVIHAFHRDDQGRIHQETRAGGKIFKAVVQYAFGSGDRAMTLVGREPNGQARELRLSDYPRRTGEGRDSPRVPRWDRTSGHPVVPPKPDEYLGQSLNADDLRRCMLCHVTDPKSIAEETGPCAADRAIGCERCHGPGGNHLLAVEGKLQAIDPAIARPSMATGPEIVQLCSGCHSPRGREVLRDDPLAIRFQGTTLTWSRCYTESDGAMDCLTCHDPHRNASTSEEYYEARCLECHSRSLAPSDIPRHRPRRRSLRDVPTRTVCPVNPSTGCLGCHMPAVPGVVPHSTFTDHFIRVHKEESGS